MRRGTTPTIIATVDDIDVTLLDEVLVTFKQGHISITKDLNDIEIPDEHTLEITLEQDDTLQFAAKPIQMQIKAKLGTSVFASEIKTVSIEQILEERVI